MDKKLYEEMFFCEDKHWWFLGKREIILYLASHVLKDLSQPTICDIGCGTGILLQELGRIGNAWGMDTAEDAIHYCIKRGLTNVKFGKLPDDIPFSKNSFDLILLLDVLEHVDDDRAVLESCRQLLKPNGCILLTVPAYQFLWTKRDDFHHHKRRYTKSQLSDTIKSSGLAIKKISYYNTFLFPIALLDRITTKLLKQDKFGLDLSLPVALINRILKSIFASEKYLLKHSNLPYGLSLIAISSRRGKEGGTSSLGKLVA